jgi:hypothetical protein
VLLVGVSTGNGSDSIPPACCCSASGRKLLLALTAIPLALSEDFFLAKAAIAMVLCAIRKSANIKVNTMFYIYTI